MTFPSREKDRDCKSSRKDVLTATGTSSLPQPPTGNRNTCDHQPQRYRYVPHDELTSTFFPSRLETGTLCWVLKSKGQKRVTQPPSDDTATRRRELFMRARVVSDDGDETKNGRVLVRYPKGSTYHVRRSNLIPVLEPTLTTREGVVLVIPETPEYRRAAVVHTCVGECFLEIGCDYGLLVDRVQRAVTVPEGDTDDVDETSNKKCSCLGIDKSQESIHIATKRYPDCKFAVEDVLLEPEQLFDKCKEVLEQFPSVIAMDIGGNRNLPAVLQSLQHVMPYKRKPRLIIIKSRELYQQVSHSQQDTNRPQLE